MTKNSLWDKLLKVKVLKHGWHLARNDVRNDFAEDLFSTDTFAIYLDRNIQEISNKLATDTYIPHALFRVEVPKGSLGFRPGAVIHIEDRIVLYSIVLLIAEKIDNEFTDSVYSWRLKKPIPKKGGIFKETSILDMPYLKRATISRIIDPFESWYVAWPDFDKESKRIFQVENFRYMATSDIAAFFENIQLPILRDQLLSLFSNDPKLINLLNEFLESWTFKTGDGRSLIRGIPQGNSIFSFLGNFFLLPLDREFTDFQKKYKIKYYRYMDDVRIFSREIRDARYAIFLMDRILRNLHLNVQTAKTKIYDENYKEISNFLIDPRIDRLEKIHKKIDEFKENEINSKIKNDFLRKLKDISKQQSRNKDRFIGTRKILFGLSMRAFLMWINAHIKIGSHYFVKRLIKEIKINPDHRLTKKLIKATKEFPRKRNIERAILQYIQSENIIYPYQKAECLRALRYLSRISEKTIKLCLENINNVEENTYVRMQSSYLLNRVELSKDDLDNIIELYRNEIDVYVKSALVLLIIQKRKDNTSILKNISVDPNYKISELGKLLSEIKENYQKAKKRFEHIFRDGQEWLICDNMSFLHLVSLSKNRYIKEMLCSRIKYIRKNCWNKKKSRQFI